MKSIYHPIVRLLASGYCSIARIILKKAVRKITNESKENRRIGNILLAGDVTSVKFFKSALEKLMMHHGSGFHIAQRYLTGIVVSPFPVKRSFLVNTVFCTIGQRDNLTEERFAALVVRYAVEARIFASGIYAMAFYHKRCRRAAYLIELQSMIALGCNDEWMEQQRQFLEALSS